MIDFNYILDKIPDYTEYLSVDELNKSSEELAKDYPNTVKLIDVGKSTSGESIKCLKIGEGKYRALIYGFPNPEEPLGGVLLEYFSRLLAENKALLRQLDYTWCLIKCIDPDGARLNEGFLKGPFTPLNFVKNYYRTPTSLAGEFNFPYRVGDLNLNNPQPETKALMNIMDKMNFDFISSLHNWKWGGIYFRFSEPCPQIYAPLQQLAKSYNVPFEKRPQDPSITLTDGITLGWFTGIRNYFKFKAAGREPLEELTGAFILEYAQLLNPDVLMFVPECGIWYDERYWDKRPSDITMAELIKYMQKTGSETNNFLLYLYKKAEPLLKTSSPLLIMIQHLIDNISTPKIGVYVLKPELEKRDLERRATIGEKIAAEGRVDVYRINNLGGMIRMFNHQLSQHGEGRTILESYKAEAESRLEEWNKIIEKKYDLKCYRIKDLISMNLGAILYSTEYVKWKYKWG